MCSRCSKPLSIRSVRRDMRCATSACRTFRIRSRCTTSSARLRYRRILRGTTASATVSPYRRTRSEKCIQRRAVRDSDRRCGAESCSAPSCFHLATPMHTIEKRAPCVMSYEMISRALLNRSMRSRFPRPPLPHSNSARNRILSPCMPRISSLSRRILRECPLFRYRAAP